MANLKGDLKAILQALNINYQNFQQRLITSVKEAWEDSANAAESSTAQGVSAPADRNTAQRSTQASVIYLECKPDLVLSLFKFLSWLPITRRTVQIPSCSPEPRPPPALLPPRTPCSSCGSELLFQVAWCSKDGTGSTML